MEKDYTQAILKYIYILFRMIFTLAIILGILFIIYYAFKLAFPFIIAAFIAFLINPLINLMADKARIPRGLSTFLVLILIFAIIAGLITLIIVGMISGITYLTDEVPSHVQVMFDYLQHFFFMRILPIWEKFTHLINTLNPSQQTTIEAKIQDLGKQTAITLGDVGTNIIKFLRDILLSLPNFITIIIFVMLATFFISKDWYRMARIFNRFTSGSVQERSRNIYDDLRRALFGYIKAQITLISITGLIILVGLLILRVAHPVTIAFVSALADLLPYLGTGTIFIPWIIYNFFSHNFFLTIGLSILYALVIIQRQMMEPKILSSNIGLHPLPTLISLFVGFKLFGVLGLAVGPTSLVIYTTLAQANVFKDIWQFILGENKTKG